MTTMLIEWIAVAGIGAMIGFAGGLFGVGGGMIAVPVLALGFGLEQQFAQGTTYVMAAPTSLMGLWYYYRHGSVDRRNAIGIAIAGSIAAYLGTRLALDLDPQQLRRVFSVFLLILVFYMVVSELPRFAPRTTRKLLDMRWSPLVGAFCGTLTGFFTIGGAMCAPPLLTRFFGLAQQKAQGLAFAAILLSLISESCACGSKPGQHGQALLEKHGRTPRFEALDLLTEPSVNVATGTLEALCTLNTFAQFQ